jgi:hypothetical protein
MPVDYRDYHPKWSLITRLILKRDRYRCLNCGARKGDIDPYGRKIIITIAHLARDRRINNFKLLGSLCLRCHLLYDRIQHAHSRRYGKQTNYVNGKLFDDEAFLDKSNQKEPKIIVQMPITILVSSKKYDELKQANSAKVIVEQHRVKETVEVDGISYCITSVQQGLIIGYRITTLTSYTGTTAPLTWKAHAAEINAGRRPRSYDGLMLKYRGSFAVLTGEYVRFEMHSRKLEQLSMF